MIPTKSRVLLLAFALAVASCHDDKPARPRVTTTTSAASARSEAAGQPVEVLGRWRRTSAPTGVPADEVGPIVVVTDDVSALWQDWGPDGSDRAAPPDTDGSSVAIVWDGIGGLTVNGVDVADGALSIVGVRLLPGDGCPSLDDVGETTIVDLGDVTAPEDVGVGLPRIVQSVGPPC